MELFSYHSGDAPIIINVPHAGTYVPEELKRRMSSAALQLPDTDWFVDQLYQPIAERLGAHMLVATHSRYVLDLNRAPDDASLYPGRFTTGLCPTVQFDGEPIYNGDAPDADEMAERWQQYGAPYHMRLMGLIEDVKQQHGAVLLYDAHSIASRVPSLFDGELVQYNLGTAGGESCSGAIAEAAAHALPKEEAVVNGRFKGGYITRYYGKPKRNVHAIQMELAQRGYMDEAAVTFDEARAEAIRPVLEECIRASSQHL